MIYHVSKTGSDINAGTQSDPFLTISKAAETARPGDTVTVHEGVYRECVSPLRGGISAYERIVYTAAEGEKVIIKGSEIVKGWQKDKDGIWSIVIDCGFFGGYNPYTTTIDGDWLMSPIDKFLHTGAVYLNGEALKEVTDKENLGVKTWYCEADENTVVIYANFDNADPNEGIAEINVRKSCFSPERTGVNYITVRGFEMAHAATPWAPPTADQPGLICTHWSKGWIIENNIIHDSRCGGISVGKDISTGNNPYTTWHRKSGYQYQLEVVFNALHAGWSKETVGSHIIRNNTVYDCGQNGIVGNLGGAFSQIYNNHIYNIGNKREFFGFEIAGIKLHAAIDTQIHHNVIHDCLCGTWLDWQAQGARLSSNIYFDNIDKDLWIEVTHGPFIADHNIFASKVSMTNNAQGGAYVNNLFGGSTIHYNVPDRSTPYHLPHSTEVAGCAAMYGGDNRYYNNIFCGTEENGTTTGNHYYNGSPVSLEEYQERVLSHGRGDIETFKCERQPVYIDCNCYLDGALPFDREEHTVCSEAPSQLSVSVKDGGMYLEITLPEDFPALAPFDANTETLGMPRIAEAPFENPDGTPLTASSAMIGPVPGLKPGKNRIDLRILR